MSTIRKKPFIEKVLDAMSDANKLTLKTLLDTGGSNEDASFSDLPDKGVTAVYFQLDKNNFKTGLLIYDNTQCVLIAYHRFQDLLLYKLDVSKHTYEQIKEYCDINELRRALDDSIENGSSHIDPSGDVVFTKNVEIAENLVVNGDTELADVEADTIHAENIVTDELHIGNSEIIDDNGEMQISQLNVTEVFKIGGVIFTPGEITAELTGYELEEGVDLTSTQVNVLMSANAAYLEYDGIIYMKANQDETANEMRFGKVEFVDGGRWVVGCIIVNTTDGSWTVDSDDIPVVDGIYDFMTVGNAKQLVATVGSEDNAPYLYRTSGGSASIGNRVNEKYIEGGSVALGQLVENGNFATDTVWTATYGSKSVANNKLTYTVTQVGTGTQNRILQYSKPITSGHKYLVGCKFKPLTKSYKVGFLSFATDAYTISDIVLGTANANEEKSLWKIVTATNNGPADLRYYFTTTETREINDQIEISNCMVIDLTQVFGSTIADYLATLPIDTALEKIKPWIDVNKYYEYDADPEFKHVSLSKKKVTGLNQWDEQVRNGYYSSTTGAFVSYNGSRANKNLIIIFENTTYYCKSSQELWAYFYDANDSYISRVRIDNRTFTTPVNASSMNFSNTYDAGDLPSEVCINISWSGAHNGEYKPYDAKEYDMVTGTLRGILKLDSDNNIVYDGDRHYPDGHTDVRYRVLELTESFLNNWLGTPTVVEGNIRGQIALQSPYKPAVPASGTSIPNVICNGVDTISNDDWYYASKTGVSISRSGYGTPQNLSLTLVGATTKQEMVDYYKGKFVIYLLETPTTSQGTPYTEIQDVDDWGTEEFIPVSGNDMAVGHNSFYQANLRDKVQNLPDNADSNGLYLIKQTGSQQSLVAYTEAQQETGVVLSELNLTAISGGFESTETFANKHIHVLFEIETTGLHYGADFDLHPYNGSQCLVAFRMLVSGQYKDGMAYIDENNKAVIMLPDVSLSGATVTAHYYEYR